MFGRISEREHSVLHDPLTTTRKLSVVTRRRISTFLNLQALQGDEWRKRVSVQLQLRCHIENFRKLRYNEHKKFGGGDED